MHLFWVPYLLCWFLLISASFNLSSLAYGLVAFGITYVICKTLSIKLYNPLSPRLMIYAGWLAKEVVTSAINMARICWSRQLPMPSSPQWIKSGFTEELQITYAYSITITPGTVAILIDDRKLLVHAITPQSITDLTTLSMENKITQLLQ